MTPGVSHDLVLPAVRATPAARAAVRRLVVEHGRLMFVQSAGCCAGSDPMCFRDGEFRVGAGDVLVGEVEGCPVYVDRRHLEAWPHPVLAIDVEPGFAGGLSLAAGEGLHFVATSPPR